jgi:hypothetical protein
MATTASVFIDEIEVTDIALEGSVTHRLNRPWTAQVKLPMQDAIGGAGSLLKVYFDGVLQFHGRVLLSETTADENTGYTVYNATDALELWAWRPVRDPDGDFTNPSIIEDNVTGPAIVEAMFDNSIFAGAGPPSDSEGALRLAKGSFAGGGVDLTGAPTDWPMTMAELATLLVGTGEVDIVVTPIELDIDSNYGQIDVYNGDFGTDRTATVVFEYGFGARNISKLRWNEDMTKMANKIWYYLGPRLDPQHWRANITGTDPALPDPPQTAVAAMIAYSRAIYDVRMEIRVYDARGDEATVGRDLYRRLWQIESWLRAQSLSLLHITPTRDTAIGTFEVGDLISVDLAAAVGGVSHIDSTSLSGAQRVYEFTTSWDEDSVCAIGELQVSSDNEGI